MRKIPSLAFLLAILAIASCLGRSQRNIDPCQDSGVKGAMTTAAPETEAAQEPVFDIVESRASCELLVKKDVSTCERWFQDSDRRENILIVCPENKAYTCVGRCTESAYGTADTCEGGYKTVAATPAPATSETETSTTPAGTAPPAEIETGPASEETPPVNATNTAEVSAADSTRVIPAVNDTSVSDQWQQPVNTTIPTNATQPAKSSGCD